MAGAKRCLGVDLGAHTIKIAEMALDANGIRVVRMLSESVPVGPAAQEAERKAAIVSTVRKMLKENKVATKKAVFSMSGQTVFVRRIRVPKAPQPRLDQIIRFEARQLIPFPLEKTLLQYQIYASDEPRDLEVLLVAMKKETNDEFMKLVRRIGLRPVGISISSLALFSGQELAYFDFEQWQATKGGGGGFLSGLKSKKTKDQKKKDKKKKGKKGKKGEEEPDVAGEVEDEDLPDLPDELAGLAEGGLDEVRAYVNIGARTTDIAICKGGAEDAVGFTRTIPVGGNQITTAIMRAKGSEAFQEAEQIKMEQTAVLSGTFEFEADADKFDDEANTAATKICDRMIAEIRRTLDYYISQPDGMAVDLVMLSGGGANLSYLDGYIEERLGLPVEVSSGPGNASIKTPSQFAEDFNYAPYKIALGLAAQGLDISSVEIDFLPAEIQVMRDFSGQYIEMAVLAGLIGVMVFFGSQLGETSMQTYRTQIDQFERAIRSGQPRQKKFDQANLQRAIVENQIELLSAQLTDRDYVLDLLLAVEGVRPATVLVTYLSYEPDYTNPLLGNLSVYGEALSQPAATTFVRGLQENEEFVANAQMKNTRPNVQSQHFKEQVFQFMVQAQVKKPDGKPLTRVEQRPRVDVPTPVPESVRGGGGRYGTDRTRQRPRGNTGRY